MRQNQYQVNDRTHTTNTPRQDTHGQHWMSARAMSAHFFTSLHPCLTQSGTYDGVESRGWSDTHSHCSAQFTTLITPNISIERPDAHLADGPTQDVAMANHRPCLRGFKAHAVSASSITGVSSTPERTGSGKQNRLPVARASAGQTARTHGRPPCSERAKRSERSGTGGRLSGKRARVISGDNSRCKTPPVSNRFFSMTNYSKHIR